MLFSSVPFLYYFLPATLFLYAIAPKCLKNTVLLLVSLFFYAWGEPRYIAVMSASVALGYVFGILIERFRGKRAAKVLLFFSVASSLAFLLYFKYADFFITNWNAVTGFSVPLLELALPIGISFYTFQILSYTVDVYRGDVRAQKNPINLAAYITLFPQLIAGPIVRYADVDRELSERTHTMEKVALGIRRFVLGLAKKILIADALAAFCSEFAASGEKSVLFFWLYAVAFSLQIYFDFSGYSDMAIGLGKMFGFEFLENFNYPYISGSITEFWRRWHMSLGSWFRDYVYIPLGGNRVSKVRGLFNIFVVWMLTGFWHGASWNFIFWGLFFAFLLLIEKLWLLPYLKTARVWNHVYVLAMILFSFVLFASEDMETLLFNIRGMFGFSDIPAISAETLYYLRSYAVIFVVAIIGSTPLVKKGLHALQEQTFGEKALNMAEPIALVLLLLVMTGYLVDGSFSPFLYFRF